MNSNVSFINGLRNWIRFFHQIYVANFTIIKRYDESLPDQCIDLADLDVIQLLDSRLDLMFVGFQVSDKDQSVVVFNLLHSWLSCQGMLDDVMSVHAEVKWFKLIACLKVGWYFRLPITSRCRLPGVLWVPGGPKGLGSLELYSGTDFLHTSAMCTLNNFLLDLLGFLHRFQGSLLVLWCWSFFGRLLGDRLFALRLGFGS